MLYALQLEAMSRTDILITPCGGVGTVLTFLPPGATAIVMNYWHTTLQTSVQMERNYYWNLEYLDIQFFPVLPEDYELTTDRPSCEKGADDPYLEGQVGRISWVAASCMSGPATSTSLACPFTCRCYQP